MAWLYRYSIKHFVTLSRVSNRSVNHRSESWSQIRVIARLHLPPRERRRNPMSSILLEAALRCFRTLLAARRQVHQSQRASWRVSHLDNKSIQMNHRSRRASKRTDRTMQPVEQVWVASWAYATECIRRHPRCLSSLHLFRKRRSASTPASCDARVHCPRFVFDIQTARIREADRYQTTCLRISRKSKKMIAVIAVEMSLGRPF